MINFKSSSLILIDAIIGMTRRGSFGKIYDYKDLERIEATIFILQNFLNNNSDNFASKSLIKSIYAPGKFTSNEDDPLYNLCVSDSNDLQDMFPLFGEWYLVTKLENDATKDCRFINWINSYVIKKSVKTILLAGFTLSSCIKETAQSIKRLFPDLEVILPLNLIGIRNEYLNNSKFDIIITELKDNNIKIYENI